jgi:hypothetical protein
MVWGWYGGGLTWVAQSSDISRLTKLAIWLGVRLSAPCRDGGGTVWARQVPDDRWLEGGKPKEVVEWALRRDGRGGKGSLDEEKIFI